MDLWLGPAIMGQLLVGSPSAANSIEGSVRSAPRRPEAGLFEGQTEVYKNVWRRVSGLEKGIPVVCRPIR